ncbi:MAG TPA: manganese efflux pump [Bacillota bacterium]|nr:manganese efflux pump [Bacillota bacterium]HPZ14296.1 manganese efflux pump [Bacillota bacterium]
MRFAEVILISMAISADAFGAGLVYGLRKIQAQFHVVCAVGLISSVAVAGSTWLGGVTGGLLDPKTAATIGGVVLALMGAWLALEGFGEWSRRRPLLEASVVSVRLKPVGLVVQIMRDPEAADIDRSGVISVGEALLLGTALALDSLGTGLGAGFAGADWWSVAPVAGALTCACFRMGILVGGRMPEGWGGLWLRLAPGIVLILMGIAAFGRS